jgi:hypothetical protein
MGSGASAGVRPLEFPARQLALHIRTLIGFPEGIAYRCFLLFQRDLCSAASEASGSKTFRADQATGTVVDALPRIHDASPLAFS